MNFAAALEPNDSHNQRLADHVRPADWINPTPAGRYNLVVIGAGTAGLVTAAGAAGLGARVALIERGLMGGDCLNVGCVPSKALIAAARGAAITRNSESLGIRIDGTVQVDFAAVMERMRRLRSSISPHDSAARFRDLGIDVFLGSGKFVGNRTVEVDGIGDNGVTRLSYKRAVIATGARAARLPIDGYDEVSPLTNETIFSLTELPPRLTVIGGGPIGCEMAQSFARFGSQVTQIEKAGNILAREDPDAAVIVQDSMKHDGVDFRLNAEVLRFEKRGNDKVTVYSQNGSEHEVAADHILIGIGRAPNVENLGLETVGVKFDLRRGVEVNDQLQTANSNIYAAGDVATKYKFTHSADFLARNVIRNTLFLGRAKASQLVIPWATYTAPELAHVGVTPQQAQAENIPIDTLTQPFSGVDRAILEGNDEGFARVHLKKGTDKIIGATIVGEGAGDMIGELTLAMTHGLGLKQIATTIHPYPTTADAIRRLGDQYNKTRLTPLVAGLMKRWLAWTR